MGSGWMELEHVSNGFEFGEPRGRASLLREQIEIVVRQWTEEEFSFEGEHYRLESSRALPKPVQQPRPPLIVGGGGKRGTVGPAVRWADEYNTTFARRTTSARCGRSSTTSASWPGATRCG